MTAGVRIARVWVPGRGASLGLCEGPEVRVPPASAGAPADSLDALCAESSRTHARAADVARSMLGGGQAYSYRDLDRAPAPDRPHLMIPIAAPEVWAAGVTYERSREARLAETTTAGIYDKVYDAERPEVFFKATASRCVGPNAPVGVRADSRWTVPEPELAAVLGADGSVVGYTLGNDMSARDIEGENPLYLPQAKIYRACCSLGPVVVLTDAPLERDLVLRCRIARGGRAVFSGEVATSRLRRPLRELIDCLRRANDVPPMTVLLTGTGIVPPDEFACEAGDVIEISADEIGVLRNPAVRVA
ncbi:MAG TPA: fumarylacetoacetate hydrolase family protein [bacterium]|nr:fumarylacetoacetate hydrolase family protein [bacterium]